jgi:hypothetical protein
MPYPVETLVDAAGGQPRAKPLTVSIGLAASMPVSSFLWWRRLDRPGSIAKSTNVTKAWRLTYNAEAATLLVRLQE